VAAAAVLPWRRTFARYSCGKWTGRRSHRDTFPRPRFGREGVRGCLGGAKPQAALHLPSPPKRGRGEQESRRPAA
jgi:hypothetical protein